MQPLPIPIPDQSAGFEEWLRLDREKLKKGERTRLDLLLAAARHLADQPLESMTVAAMSQAAGVAHGTFYLYFDNRSDAAVAVWHAFRATLRVLRPRGMARQPAWTAIWQVNRLYVAFYARNARIAAAVELLTRERPEILASRDHINQRWAQILLRDLMRRRPGMAAPDMADDDRTRTLLGLRYVIMMADEALRQTFADPPEHLKKLTVSEEEVTDILTRLWYRGIYAEDPPEAPGILPDAAEKAAVRA